jgi:hypothetical protein
VFESLRATLSDLLGGRVSPADRRGVLTEMKRALVLAKLGVEDLHEGAEVTRRRLATERDALATATRRRTLAEGINDTETAALAARYETQHAERIAMLERKLDAQEAEFGLAEREYDAMVTQMKQASAGVGAGVGAGMGAGAADEAISPRTGGVSDEELGLRDDRPLNRELDAVARAQRRKDREAGAEDALEALKRRMGKTE